MVPGYFTPCRETEFSTGKSQTLRPTRQSFYSAGKRDPEHTSAQLLRLNYRANPLVWLHLRALVTWSRQGVGASLSVLLLGI